MRVYSNAMYKFKNDETSEKFKHIVNQLENMENSESKDTFRKMFYNNLRNLMKIDNMIAVGIDKSGNFLITEFDMKADIFDDSSYKIERDTEKRMYYFELPDKE